MTRSCSTARPGSSQSKYIYRCSFFYLFFHCKLLYIIELNSPQLFYEHFLNCDTCFNWLPWSIMFPGLGKIFQDNSRQIYIVFVYRHSLWKQFTTHQQAIVRRVYQTWPREERIRYMFTKCRPVRIFCETFVVGIV